MTAPTPERRVGEARLAEIVEQGDWLLPDGRVEQIRDRMVMDSTVGEASAFPLSMVSDLYRETLYQAATVRSFARNLLDAQKEVARLTAEVERLRGEAGELRALVKYAAQNCDDVEVAELIARRLALLSLPPNRPDANNGK